MKNKSDEHKNVRCLNCHRADVDLIGFLKLHFGTDKVFVGFIQGTSLGVSISPEITFSDTLVIADTIKKLAQEF